LKKILFILCSLLIQQSFPQQFGVGVVAPRMGAHIMMGNEDGFVEASIMFSNPAFAKEAKTPVEIKPFSLFYNRITSVKTNKWSPFIGFGGMYIPYKYKNSFLE
jgi:hypothetical protein